MADVQITITENGPYKVTGPIDLFDAGGNPVATKGSAVFLCRCGGSRPTNRVCDGTHSKLGFEGAIAAVQEADG